MTMTVPEGVLSELKALAQEYKTSPKVILRALVYMTRDPYNKNMLAHLVKIEQAAQEFDRAFNSRKHDEAAQAARKLKEIVHDADRR